MYEFAISENYETAVAAFADLERMRSGSGRLVADYLSAEIAQLASDPEVQNDVLDEGVRAAALLGHFAGLKSRDVADIDAKRRVLAVELSGAASVVAEYRFEDPRSTRIIEAAQRLGAATLAGAVERPNITSAGDAERVIMRYINTSGTGEIITLEAIKGLFGDSYKPNARQISQALAKLSSGTRGRVLEGNGERYMLLNKPGHPEAVPSEVDEALSFTDSHAEAALLALGHGSRRVDSGGVDASVLGRFIEGARERMESHELSVNELRAEAVTRLREMFNRPWLVARALEILPSKDPRHYLLSELVADSRRRSEILDTLDRFVIGLDVARRRNVAGYTVTRLPDATPPASSSRRPKPRAPRPRPNSD